MSHLRDIKDFKEAFDAQRALNRSPCSGHMTSDPAVSLVDGGDSIRVDGEKARNGTTAAMIDTIMTGKNLVRE